MIDEIDNFLLLYKIELGCWCGYALWSDRKSIF